MSAHEHKTFNQPISDALYAGALLTLPTVSALTGFSKSKIYSEMKQGRFPNAIRQGVRCTRWRAGDISDWLNAVASK